MERRILSIDPYVNSGGILGEQLEVNKKAADSVMRRTALRRDFLVTKGYGREGNNVTGSDELVIARSVALFQRTEMDATPVSTLSKTPTEWVVSVNDQQLHDDVDVWMSGHFKASHGKSGTDVYKKKYSGEIDNLVAENLHKAFWDEKWRVSVGSFANTLQNDSLPIGKAVMIAVVADVAYRQVLSSITIEPIGLDYFINRTKILMYSTIGTAATYLLGVSLDSKIKGDDILKPWENYIPNPQVPSLVAGLASLSLNGSKLIRLRS